MATWFLLLVSPKTIPKNGWGPSPCQPARRQKSQLWYLVWGFHHVYGTPDMAVVVKTVLGSHFAVGAPEIGMFTGGTGF